MNIREIDGQHWDEEKFPVGTRRRVYARAFGHYGTEQQRMVAVEEMAELTKEICKLQRDGTTMDKMVDELADVKIMLEQLVMMFGCKDQVLRRMREKLDRLMQRMAEELEEWEK